MKTYTTIQGDMWDSIAYKLYGDEIFIFGAGTVLNVPELESEKETDLPSWR